MPYKYGHYYVVFVLAVILAGFWKSYFSIAGAVPFAFHAHAFSATIWLLLLILQSASIHGRHNAFHKLAGLASLGLFPLLIAGFVMIINVTAAGYAAQESPFVMLLGPSFGIGMFIAIAAYLTLFYQALRHRRNIRLHAGYMLATPLILFESPFSRLMEQAFPWMNFIGSEGPMAVIDVISISNGLAILFAMTLYFMDRKHGAPWLVASAFMAAQTIMMWFAPSTPLLHTLFQFYAMLSPEITVLTGMLAAVLVGYFGWLRGVRPIRPPVQTSLTSG
ncbi:hypothetical protein [Sphingorhabdus sp. EL138]|uniref:hypothetical protein n=1 Tax=Sphingorhabdus sp. EL138 TaxID=2073156 RepID=UPI0025F2F927|nr:hypothetical protein [Sphingorhabdus sp. EL138]